MNIYIAIALVALGLCNIALLLVLVLRRQQPLSSESFKPDFEAVIGESRRVEEGLRAEFGRQREDMARGESTSRQELRQGVQDFQKQLQALINTNAQAQGTQLSDFASRLDG